MNSQYGLTSFRNLSGKREKGLNFKVRQNKINSLEHFVVFTLFASLVLYEAAKNVNWQKILDAGSRTFVSFFDFAKQNP